MEVRRKDKENTHDLNKGRNNTFRPFTMDEENERRGGR